MDAHDHTTTRRRRFRRRDRDRTGGWTATGTSLALSVAAGLGLFAMVSNTVLSSGNSVESGTYDYEPPPAPLELQVALVDPAAPAGACDTATYDAAVVPAVLDATADLDAGTIGPVTTDVCVRSAGTFDAYLRVQNTNVLDLEVFACEPTEVDPGFDPTCADGDPGELATIADYTLVDDTGTCPGLHSYPFLPESRTSDVIPAGTTCRYSIQPEIYPGAEENDLLQAQTDRVTWDIGFALLDDLYEPNDGPGPASSLTPGLPVSATINPVDDEDWFVHEHPGGTLTAETTGACDPALGDTTLALYDSGLTEELAFDDDGGTDSCSLLTATVPADTYYVVVESYNNSLFVSDYTLTVTSS